MEPAIWTGPFRIDDLLGRCLDPEQAWPPPDRGVYLVSRNAWSSTPTADAEPLYFGGNTGRPGRFCTRVGDLIADLFGFYDARTGHHTGGQSLYVWCRESKVHPGTLHLGWAAGPTLCARCLEYQTGLWLTGGYENLASSPLLNKRRPPQCALHEG